MEILLIIYLVLLICCIVFAKRHLLGFLFFLASIACGLAAGFLAYYRFGTGREGIKTWEDAVVFSTCIILSLIAWLIPIFVLKFYLRKPG